MRPRQKLRLKEIETVETSGFETVKSFLTVKNFSRVKIWFLKLSRSRLKIETLVYLDCFETVKNFSTVKTWVLRLSKFRLLIETMSKLRLKVIKTVETWVLKLSTISWLSRLGFAIVNSFSTVNIWVLKLLRLRLTIKTLSKIETLGKLNCLDLGFETVNNFLTAKNFLTVDSWGFETVKVKTFEQEHVKN